MQNQGKSFSALRQSEKSLEGGGAQSVILVNVVDCGEFHTARIPTSEGPVAESLLRRIELLILKNKSGSDNSQVPASGAACDVYVAGTDVATGIVLLGTNTDPPPPSSQPIPVVEPLNLTSGDVVKCGPTGLQLTVDYVDGNNVFVFYSQTNNTSVPKTTRLIQLSRRASVYLDKFRVTLPSSPGTVYADSNGRVSFYVDDARVDCLVSGSGFTSRLYADVKGGTDSPSWLNAADFPSIQMAIDALPRGIGGTVFIPAGTYFLSDTLYTPCDRPCHLLGEGGALDPQDGGFQTGTVLRWTSAVGMIRLRGDGSTIRNVTLFCDGALTGTPAEDQGYGIMIGRRDIIDAHPLEGDTPGQTEYAKAGSGPFKTAVLEDVIIKNAAGWGLYIPGFGQQSDYAKNPVTGQIPLEVGAVAPGQAGGTLSIWITCSRVQVSGSRRFGACFIGQGNTTIYFDTSSFLNQGMRSVAGAGNSDSEYYVFSSNVGQLTLEKCTFEGLSPAVDSSGNGRPWVQLAGTEGALLRGCWFEEDPHFATVNGATISVTYSPAYFIGLGFSLYNSVAQVARSTEISGLRMTRAGLHNGLLRCVKATAPANSTVHGVMLSNLVAVGVDQVWNPASNGLWDQLPLDLRSATGASVGGIMTLTCAAANPIASRSEYPLLAALGGSATQLSEAYSKVPALTEETIFAAQDAPATMVRPADSGAIALSVDLAGGDGSGSDAIPSAMFFAHSASSSGWRLLNNAPVLSTDQRDARAQASWSVGDIILNSDLNVLECRNLSDAGGWRLTNALPNFVSESLPSRPFSDGEMILKEQSGSPQDLQIRVFLEGHWYAVNLTKIS